MNKKFLLLTMCGILITSCGNVTSSNDSSSISESSFSSVSSEDISSEDNITQKNIKLNSKNEYVYIYGYLGQEKFDLSSIDTSDITSKKLSYSIEKNNVKISDHYVLFNKCGTDTIIATDGDVFLTYKVLISKDKESLYSLPEMIDINNFQIREGEESNVLVNDNSIVLTSDSLLNKSRISFPLEQGFNKNYVFQVNAKIKSDSLATSRFGIVFSDEGNSESSFPYYYFSFQKDPSISGGVQLTKRYENEDEIYYNGKTQIEELKIDQVVNLKVAVQDNVVKCFANNNLLFEQELESTNAGNIGLISEGMVVEFSDFNYAIPSLTEGFDIKKVVSYASTKESRVNTQTNLKPNYISAIKDSSTLNNFSQYFIKVKKNIDELVVYSYDNEKINKSLNVLFNENLGKKIPNIQLSSKEEVDLLRKYLNAHGIIDLNIWSDDVEVLKYTHKKISYARCGYISDKSSFSTPEEVGKECVFAGKGYASLIMVDNDLLNKSNVTWFTSRGYSVVSDASKNFKIGDVVDSVLDGCSLILTNDTIDASKEIELINNDEIFIAKSSSSLESTENSLFYQPHATGHRGSGGTLKDEKGNYLVENTLESFDWAFENGAMSIEIDIHTTSDNQLIVCHNATTSGISNEILTIKNCTLSQLQNIEIIDSNGNAVDTHLPSLKEVFERYNDEKYFDKTMVIEIKDGSFETAKKAIELSKNYGWYGRFVMISFSESVCRQIVDYDSSIKVGYLDTVSRYSIEKYWESHDKYLSDLSLSSHYETIRDPNSIIGLSNSRGQIYWIWTFNENTGDKTIKFINAGNKGFTTDYLEGFSSNQYKLVSDSLTYNLSLGESKSFTCKSIDYVGKEVEVVPEIIVVSGPAKVENNIITRTGEGDIKICLRYKTKWIIGASSTYYYIYSDLLTIN